MWAGCGAQYIRLSMGQVVMHGAFLGVGMGVVIYVIVGCSIGVVMGVV